MKYISIQDLLDHGKELRFQSAEQMAKVYEELPSIEIVRCKNCSRWCICHHSDDWFCADGERIGDD